MAAGVEQIPGIENVVVYLGVTQRGDAATALNACGDFIDQVDSIMIDDQFHALYGWPEAIKLIRGGSKGNGVFVHANFARPPAVTRHVVEEVARLHPKYLSVNLANTTESLNAAVEGIDAANSYFKTHSGLPPVNLIGTALEAYESAEDCQAIHHCSTEQWVEERATLAKELGFDGVMAPGLDASILRSVGVGIVVATGNRLMPNDVAHDDQIRITHPATVDADLYVFGRPLTKALDPLHTAQMIGDALTRREALQS